MEPTVGILIVHGIGDQRRGPLRRRIARALVEGASTPAPPSTAPHPDTNGGRGTTAEAVQRVSVEGRPVLVAEAHWADLSSPDNPPELHVAAYLLPEYLRTVAGAW